MSPNHVLTKCFELRQQTQKIPVFLIRCLPVVVRKRAVHTQSQTPPFEQQGLPDSSYSVFVLKFPVGAFSSAVIQCFEPVKTVAGIAHHFTGLGNIP